MCTECEDRRIVDAERNRIATIRAATLLFKYFSNLRIMPDPKLSRHPGLFATTRLRIFASEPLAAPLADWLLLFSFGAIAAICSACLDLQIRRIPGHAILRVVFPIALGFALVPRRNAGTVMGGSALVTAMLLRVSGMRSEGLGFGALTSLLATGPLLDRTLRHANGGWKPYAAFAFAGLSSNLLALLTRGTAKWIGFEAPGRRPIGEWLMQASITYTLCGLAAGLISGIVFFYARRSAAEPASEHTS